MTVSRNLVPILLLSCASVGLVACKGGRKKLEQLVPDGATGMMSVDLAGLMKTEMYSKVEEGLSGLGDEATPNVIFDELRDECELDIEKAHSMVVGFDAISQSAMMALRMPNAGKKEALECLETVLAEHAGAPKWELSETDGKVTIDIDGGEGRGWAMDSDTLVISSKGWVSAVEARIEGESKGAVDNNLKEAVALADRSKHIWFAGQVPAVVESFVEKSPLEGVRRGAGSIHYGDDLEIAVAVEFADEAAAKAIDEQLRPKLDGFKTMAVAGGLPQGAVDSLEMEVDGAIVRGSVEVPMAPLLEETTKAFTKYVDRSKTSEARVQIGKIFDGASAYFLEEHIAQAALEVAPHACPNDGRTEGEAGVTPPLSVECHEGPGGKCVPMAGGKEGAGYYDISAWTDNPVWNGLNMQMEQGHYFHYNFRWKNDPTGFGSCMFTAQAFGDLDGDGVYSTYERAGAADQNGVNAAAGLYIDREVE